MKAVLINNYGPPEVLTLAEIEKPKPKEDQILVKVHAATVCLGDTRLRSSNFPTFFWIPARLMLGIFRPKKKILGHEFAGIVEETGENVTRFKVGDEVFGTTSMLNTGSYAEYICLPEQWNNGVVDLKPVNSSFSEAAALPIGGMTALYLLEKANLKRGQKILVYGASGSVGSYAVQIAKLKGAEVTAVCSASNFDMMRSLGIEKLIDYRTKNYWELEDKYDIIFDAVGKTSRSKAKKVLSPAGKYVTIMMFTKEKTEHLKQLKQWVEDGKLKSFIDKRYTLDKIVKAHSYVDQGHKRGNVVIDIVKDEPD
ncbi:NAD(P)-dependent alcohol dehydrogenase [Flavobacteriaceae bacterium M23B6Z8]